MDVSVCMYVCMFYFFRKGESLFLSFHLFLFLTFVCTVCVQIDIDGDGDLDVAATSFPTDASLPSLVSPGSWWWKNEGAGYFAVDIGRATLLEKLQ